MSYSRESMAEFMSEPITPREELKEHSSQPESPRNIPALMELYIMSLQVVNEVGSFRNQASNFGASK